jgi:hypothetical protein
MAIIRCASYNIRANISDVTDPAERERFDRWATQMVQRGIDLVTQLSPRIWKHA